MKMARIYPDHPLSGTLSNAERRVFYSLKDLLPPEYIVLYSVPIYQRSQDTDLLLDGEIDFLVIHPDKGMVIIEVKGGGVGFDGKTGKWTSISFDGSTHEIKNPYEQGKKYLYPLIKDLEKNHLTKDYKYPCGHAVWFPDVDLKNKKLGISEELGNITLDRNDLEKPAKSIETLFVSCLGIKKWKEPGSAGVRALISYLAPSWMIRISMSSLLSDEDRALHEATVSQYRILSLLQRHQRALICGAAGTGKTFLAIEKARRLSDLDNKMRILLVCFNIRLAEKLREILNEYKNIDVFHFHGLCTKLCKDAAIPVPQPDPFGSNENYFKFDLPDILMEALCYTDDRYDALIVDEGQDFESTWWVPLMETLGNPKSDIFYIFYDDNQVLYERQLNFPIADEPFHLTENCRNTKNIHQEVMKYYKGDVLPSSIGPEGQPPKIIRIKTGNQEHQAVEHSIYELLNKERINSQKITILTPCKEDNSSWKSGSMMAGKKISWTARGDNYIYCSTIHSFKGLESAIIIATELNKLPVKTQQQLLYVAFSRAQSYLVIVSHE